MHSAGYYAVILQFRPLIILQLFHLFLIHNIKIDKGLQ
jgi:hypothetical protein